jgi:hypothetical protein
MGSSVPLSTRGPVSRPDRPCGSSWTTPDQEDAREQADPGCAEADHEGRAGGVTGRPTPLKRSTSTSGGTGLLRQRRPVPLQKAREHWSRTLLFPGLRADARRHAMPMLLQTYPASRIGELLPHNWAPSRPRPSA